MSKVKFIAEPGRQEVTLIYTLDAPKDVVFKALTDPQLTPQWWGPRNMTTDVEEMDVKPGGKWRFVQHDSKGGEFSFHGVYHDVTPNDRLIYTFEYEGMPCHVLLETITLIDEGGKTKMIDQSVYQSVEDRDGMVSYGMEQGATESMERLAELLEKISSKAEG
jgi:uncharacterized protein YndB with AHSA1/START domain